MWSIVLDAELRLKHCRTGIKALLNSNLKTNMNKNLKNYCFAVIIINWLKQLLMAIINTFHHSLEDRGRLNITYR